MDIKSFKQKIAIQLAHIYDEGEIEAVFFDIMRRVLNLSKMQISLNAKQILNDSEIQEIEKVIKDLKNNKPLQYIFGTATFYGLIFNVNESVLIPRPETEELVDWVLQIVSEKNKNQSFSVLDIGTGSGCIPISIKKNAPLAKVMGMDISRAALQVANENAVLNQVEVGFVELDILAIQSQKQYFETKFEVIVSNPPYITEAEKTQMHRNVLDNEPHLALFVGDENPLLFYEAITNFALHNLVENGFLFFEINECFGKEVQLMLQQKGFENVELRKDMQNKDRMVKAQLNKD